MSRGAAALPPETPRIELQPLPAAPGHSCFRSWTVHPKWGTGEGGPALGAVLLPKESVRATGGVSPGGFGGVGGGGWAQRSGPPDPSFLHGPGQGQRHHAAHTSPSGVWHRKSRSSVLGLAWAWSAGEEGLAL